MGDIIPLQQRVSARRKAKAKGKTLCGSGFHRWQVVSERRFDVKLGRLVTLYRCQRCGAEKTRAL